MPPVPTYAPPESLSSFPASPSDVTSSPQTISDSTDSTEVPLQVINTDNLSETTVAPTSPGDPPAPLPRRNPPRDRRPPTRYCASANSTYSPKFASFICTIHSLQEPKSYSQAVKSP